MPFTLSHAVLAPPIAKLTGNRLPIAALAIGTMTPDLYRLLVETEIYLNHQWKGIIYPDLLVGLLFCFFWYALYRPMLFKFLGVSKPLNIHSFSTFCKFLLSMMIAIIVGTATHIIWDGLTHLDFRTFAFHDFLAQPVLILGHEYPMHKVLQIGCSAIALPFLMWMAIHYFFKYHVKESLNHKAQLFGYLLFICSFFSGCIYYIYFAQKTGFTAQNIDLYHLIGFFIKAFTRGAIVCFSVGCMIFSILNYRKYFD
ncbi:MAG: DUF4184 family protein [Acinetobacter sp.]